MEKLFDVVLLDEAFNFLKKLDAKHAEKIIYNIRKSQDRIDPEIFKKLTTEIWEFRTLYQGKQYRLLAFWDKRNFQNTVVIASHGFIKKQNKVPDKEIEKSEKIRVKYFNQKQ